MEFGLDILHQLENDLEVNEKISLIFLLYDDVLVAQEKLFIMYKACATNSSPQKTNLLFEWACHEKKQWREKIVEALLIIKAYSNIIKLRIDIDKWSKHFLTDQTQISLCVNPIRKKLFNICDSLVSKEVKNVINLIRDDYKQRNINDIELYDEDRYYIQHFELYLLDLLVSKYIVDKTSQNEKDDFRGIDMNRLIDILNKIGLTKHGESLMYVQDFHNNNAKKCPEHIASMSSDHDSKESKTTQGIVKGKMVSNEKVYTIHDNENVGLVYIINEMKFQNKKKPELAAKYKERLGSKEDVINLIKTWKSFGFKTIMEDDLKAKDIIINLRGVLNNMVEEEHSVFVLCVMSHGEKDVVIGSDCDPVSIENIESLFNVSNAPKLAGKPKILIIQSCQGNKKLETVDPSSVTRRTWSELIDHDGPATNIPEKSDMVKFYSTIPYYESFRDIENGSWFIQTLCENMNQIEFHSSKNFTTLCTDVIRDVSSERFDGFSQTPIYTSTFTKELYLKKIYG